MDMGRFYDVMQWRADTRAQFNAAIKNLASVRQQLANAADDVAASASNASFGEDALAAADRLSSISNSLISALQSNAAAIARTESELQDVQSRERLMRIVVIVGVVLIVLAAVIWISR